MSLNRMSRYALLAFIVIMALVLAGCVANPDPSGQNKPTANGNNNNLPFPVLSPSVSPTISATNTIPPISSVQPSGDPNNQNLPWGSSPSIGAFTTPTVPPFTIVTQIPTESAGPSVSPTVMVIKLGAKGEEVRKMQKRLKELGYLKGTADGDFGKATEIALKEFQSRNKLSHDGVAGTATLNKLYSSAAVRARIETPTPKPTPKATRTPEIQENLYLKLGDTGADVRRLQERLINLGYLDGKANGHFDGATEKAVYAFQKRNVSYADGIAGPLTLKTLYSSAARGTSSSQGVVGMTLRVGVKDSDAVRRMQTRLRALGYYDGSSDGDFGASTQAAVKAFQANNNLKADGLAGEGTLSRLFSDNARSANYSAPTQKPSSNVTPIPKPTAVTVYVDVTPDPAGGYVTLREGSSGALVKNLQQKLKDMGYLTGVIDGKYGVSTSEAVLKFQKNYGLSQDGVAGPATQRRLFEGDFPAGS